VTVPLPERSTLRLPAARRRAGLTAEAAKLLGTPVSAALPLQRHRPPVVLAASLAEIAGLVALIATGRLAAMLVLLVLSALLVVVAATNTRRVLVLTAKGNVLLAASISGRPEAVVGPVPRQLTIPEPAGSGVSLAIEGTTWWVDRSSFRLLRRARIVQAEVSGMR
jgi:hypothetical protein